jgi:predicted alpha/beta superfamily hydrolase
MASMKPTFTLAVALLASIASAAPLDQLYLLGPDSAPHPGIPRGKIIGPTTLPSQIYSGTSHTYWVYVPAQYNPAQPTCLMIYMDGQEFVGLTGECRVPYVFDNLIYRREMPVTIGVFIDPGRRPVQPEPTPADWGDHNTNRPLEYNALDDRYSKVVTDELMPALSAQYNITTDPDGRALAGASSGAICAFTVAWHRPDQFHKVLSFVGSFTNIRGGYVYPDLILKSDPKPIRIFILDGVNDNRIPRRTGYDPRMDWHAQNIKMVQALTAKKYDVNYCFGIGTHNQRQAGAMMPEMLRWLWRDYPRADDPMDAANRQPLQAQK